MMTNADQAYNYRVAAVDPVTRTELRALWPHSPTAMVLRFEAYATFVALFTLESEQYRVGIIPLNGGASISWVPVPPVVRRIGTYALSAHPRTGLLHYLWQVGDSDRYLLPIPAL